MAKKSEINKKGRLAKSTLSVVLAASMVLTSSSFVWASPEDVVIMEEGDVNAVETPVEEVTEENGVVASSVEESNYSDEVVGAELVDAEVEVASVSYTGDAVFPEVIVKSNGTEIGKKNYTLSYSNNINAGSNAQVKVSFQGDYQGNSPITKTFTIDPMNLTSSNTVVTYEDTLGFLYTGKEQTPVVKSVVVHTGARTINLQPSDYELVAASGSDLKTAKVQTVELNSKNSNYTFATGLGSQQYTIQKSPFDSSHITVSSRTIPHGTAVANVKKYITVKNTKSGETVDQTDDAYALTVYEADGTTEVTGTLVANTTYIVQAKLDTDGTNYAAGSVNARISVGKATLATLAEDATVTVGNGSPISRDSKTGTYKTMYTGTEQAVTSVAITGLTLGTDFKIESIGAAKGKNVGTFDVALTGLGNHDGETATLTVQITPMTILANNTGTTGKTFTYSASLGKVFDGSKPGAEATNATLTLSWEVDGEDVVLEEGKDFSYTTDKGQGVVIVTGMGNYTTVDPDKSSISTLKLAYTNKDTCDLNDSSISGQVTGTFNYTGSPVTPGEDNITIMAGTYKLVKDTDFTVTYKNNTAAGDKARVVITGINRFSGTIELPFTIIGSKMAEVFSIKSIDNVAVDKTGTSSQPTTSLVKVIYTASTADAPINVYSDVKFYSNGIEVANYKTGASSVTFKDVSAFQKTGTITVEVIGAGKYEGSKLTTTYQIVGKDLATLAKAADIKDQDYTGKPVEPSVKVTLANGIVLTNGADYTVTYRDNVEPGTAYAIITGIGDFGGQIVKTFKIVGQMDQEIVVLPAQERDLKTRTLKSKATKVKYTTEPKTDVSYKSSDEKVVKVDAKTGAIEYTGVGTATITISAVESETYKAATKELTVKVLPVTPANVKVTSTAKRKVTIKAGAVKEATRYQIRIQKDGHSSVYVNVDNKGDLSKVYTTKSSGKFNVWVRAYKTIGDKDHHFSAWSAKKTVTVK